jgi:EmrB/QacA subfamily drug resistance transporter
MEKHSRVLLLVATGVFMSTLDSSMLNVALPSIMDSFGTNLPLTEWVIIVYLLTITVMLLFWGHLSRRFGQHTIYYTGTLIFSIGSLLCFLAPEIYLLIFFRSVQALGASMMMAMGPALIKSVFPQDQLGKGLGQIGIATSLGLMSGPVISGLLIRWAHWRMIFLITVPIGLLVWNSGRKLSYNTQPVQSSSPGDGNHPPIDKAGSLFWIGAVSLSLIMASHATALCCDTSNSNVLFFTELTLTVFFWAALIINETRHPAPLLPVALLKKRFFSMALASGMLSFTVLFFVLLLMPFYLRSVSQLSPDQTGYVMMSLPLCVFFVSPLAGRLHDRIGARIIATGGLAICFMSLLLLTGISTKSSPVTIALLLALLGSGQAMFLSPNSAAALAGVNHEQAGITSSLLATARNMGMLAGTALAGLFFSFSFSQLTGGLDMKDFTPELAPQFIAALQHSFKIAALIAAIAMAASWWRGKSH